VQKTGTLIDKLNVAVNVFKDKYNCLPGDCANATQFFGVNGLCPWIDTVVATTTCNGNGDGDIYGLDQFGFTNAGQENAYFFQQLILAGLITDTRYCTLNNILCTYLPGYDMGNWALTLPLPAAAGAHGFPPIIGIVSLSHFTPINGINLNGAHHAYFFGSNSNRGDSTLSPSITFRLDSKFDDGLPLSGQIQALGFAAGTMNIQNGIPASTGVWQAPCNNVIVTPSVYYNYDVAGCNVMWFTGF